MAASPTAFPKAYSTCQGPQNSLGFKRIHGKDIAHRDVLDRLIRQVRHDLSYLLEHSPDVRARFRLDFDKRGNLFHASHDRLGPIRNLYFHLLVFPDEEKLSAESFAPERLPLGF